MTTKERLEAHDKAMAEIDEKLRRLAVIAEQNEVRSGQMMDMFNRMGRIIQIHEQRIDSLEGRRPA
jgi:hypothetical protein